MEISHPVLGPCAGARLEEARLTDRQRIGVVLQGAGLLSLLEVAGSCLPDGWDGARVDSDGLLGGVAAAPGRLRPAQELLRGLLARCFGLAESGREGILGRGEARRSARLLLAAWEHDLAPTGADDAVRQVLEAAPFLWEPAFGAARRALAGARKNGEREQPWVAGPGRFRNRLLGRAGEPEPLAAILSGAEAEGFWRGPEELAEPGELAAAGRFRAATAAWERRAPRSSDERRALAACWEALGRYESALATLGEDRAVEARVLRVRCQLRLGRLGAVLSALRRLERAVHSPEITIELAEVATRAYANTGDPPAAVRWVERALAVAERHGPLAPRARILAALAAWDRRDLEAMDRELDLAVAARDDPRDAWRWHQARGLAALSRSRSVAAEESLAAALRAGRRRLPRFEAGGLWNDLGLARAEAGDLSGAERAFLHAQRLFGGCDGPRRMTLALSNLAEVRLRRGRLAGVREILESSTAENRLAGNLRGQVQDAELTVRCELAEGRPEAALAVVAAARALLERHGADWRRGELAALAARALGWLGRAEEAAVELDAGADCAEGLLEPEEIPALYALAGRRDEALAAAARRPFSDLYRAALAGEEAPAGAWEAVDRLEPARSARLVYDLERLAPGVAPAARRRRAAEIWRALGASGFAGRLDARDVSPWRAIAAWLERPARTSAEALAALFGAAGFGDARLELATDSGVETLVAGAGGPAVRQAILEASGDRLILAAPAIDEPLATLFALVRREIEARPRLEREPPRRSVRSAGWLGESPPLKAALDRLSRLAPGDLAVLVLGESGTGKELAAREIHRLSGRSRGPFVPVNCAALSETLLLSDLFGHARGAFTGADRERMGVFETAQGGTVFLDEIGDLPPVAQGMMLRVLQEGEVRRLGESLARKVDVRVVAATHRDLVRAVSQGTFRRDLYFRLRVSTVSLPPLRERGGDVLLLAEHLISREALRLGLKNPPRLSAEARKRLTGHDWPGNVRELENLMRVACLLAGDGGTIEPSDLELEAETQAAGSYQRQVDDLKRRLLTEALAASGGNRSEAARRLDLSRQALSYLIRQLRLTDLD
ncbi:MAG TPA: sigma 54-interacting transcriptional regulator [Thermoanaerobaculia bacterium]|nr:sigma 54-interacting transcriptional regulator [Thermoanaerobaculia bacterium]